MGRSPTAWCQVMRIERVAEEGLGPVRRVPPAGGLRSWSARSRGIVGLKTIAGDLDTGLDGRQPDVAAARAAFAVACTPWSPSPCLSWRRGTRSRWTLRSAAGAAARRGRRSHLLLLCRPDLGLKSAFERYLATLFVLLHQPCVRARGGGRRTRTGASSRPLADCLNVPWSAEMVRQALKFAPVSKLLDVSDAVYAQLDLLLRPGGGRPPKCGPGAPGRRGRACGGDDPARRTPTPQSRCNSGSRTKACNCRTPGVVFGVWVRRQSSRSIRYPRWRQARRGSACGCSRPACSRSASARSPSSSWIRRATRVGVVVARGDAAPVQSPWASAGCTDDRRAGREGARRPAGALAAPGGGRGGLSASTGRRTASGCAHASGRTSACTW